MTPRETSIQHLPELHTVPEYPLPIVPHWEVLLERAGEVCRIIDAHLNYPLEERSRRHPEDFQTADLTPQERVQLLTDLYAVTR